MVEHLTFNQRVMGSNPVGLTNKKGHLLRWPFLLVNSCGAEEAIGSERIVGENELEKRSLNLTVRGGPVCGSTLSRRAHQ